MAEVKSLNNSNKIKFSKVKDKSGKFFNKPNFSKDKKGNINCDIPTFDLSGDVN